MAGSTMTPEEQAQFDAMREDAQETEQPDTTETTTEAAPVEPEPQSEDDAAAVEAARPTTVPHAALHQEREARKDLQKQLAEERRQRLVLEERTNLILQRIPLSPQPEPPAGVVLPDINEDPIGHLVGGMRHLATNQQALEKAEQARAAETARLAEESKLIARAAAEEAEFVQATPDYGPASQFLSQKRDAQLRAMGYDDPVERRSILRQEAVALAARAVAQEKNVGEFVYELAKVAGWQPQPAAPAEAVAIAETPAPAAARITKIAAGQEQGRSLGNVTGSAAPPLTAQALLDMPHDQFLKMVQTPAGRAQMGQ